MFEGEKKHPVKPGPLQRNKEVKQVSGTVLTSCYIASAAIIIISVSEAVKSFGSNDSRTGVFYVALAVLGLLFSGFITIMNNRNKKLLDQQKSIKSTNKKSK
ncbi:MAG: hypothetical protein CVU91_09785 [Firmicutes bacterium HGW-Firmicutes-16]|nr:MAG: hypothetical protein CVU91_09785 [Firmicutes bacterium HGW-Firmicutes-16]